MSTAVYGNPTDINGKAIKNVSAFKKAYPKALVFDSMFEWKCYKLLEAAGFNFKFHPESREIAPSFTSLTLSKGVSKRKLIRATVRPITYTPDFAVFCNDGTTVFIEAKGFFQRDARLRYKLFQASLKTNEITLLAYDKHSLKDMEAIIEIIKTDFKGSTLVQTKTEKRTPITKL